MKTLLAHRSYAFLDVEIFFEFVDDVERFTIRIVDRFGTAEAEHTRDELAELSSRPTVRSTVREAIAEALARSAFGELTTAELEALPTDEAIDELVIRELRRRDALAEILERSPA